MKPSAALPGALAGAALASLPAGAGIVATALGALAGAAAGALLAQTGEKPALLERLAPIALLAFFVPVLTMTVAPGADMAMHVALARGLLQGGALSPAWGADHVAVYPRGFSALVALLAPLGLARAGLAAAAIAYVVFWTGLAAGFFQPPPPVPPPAAALPPLLSRGPPTLFGCGGEATVPALSP